MALAFAAIVGADGGLEDGASGAVVPWWSVTKTLVAACTLRLAEDGRLALDRPLPGVPYSLRDLLQHRAGIGNYGGMRDYHEAVARGDEPWSEAELLARIPPDRLLFAPRAGWAYSNVGYLLVRRAIEAATGAGLAEALRTLVLAPLGLEAARLAVTRADMRETAFAGAHGYHPGWAYHGTVIGPVAEAALALHRLLHGDLLRPASRAALLDRHPIGGPLEGRPWHETGYGLGVMTGTMLRPGMAEPLEVAGHSAGGPGSVGAVYGRLGSGPPRTAAVFMEGSDEGLAEEGVLRSLVCA